MNSNTTTGEQRRSELTELRRELREKQSYLDDDREDLWADISRWLLQSYNAPVGSLRTMVRSKLAELQENPQHKLYDHPEVDQGEEAFPEDCKGCPHYGVQCPVLARHITNQTLERIFDEAEDDVDLQGKLSSYAADHHCQVIQDQISKWETGYEEFLSEGERLRMELLADINGHDLDGLGLDVERALAADADGHDRGDVPAPVAGSDAAGGTLKAAADGGPPDEAADRIAALTDDLMTEEGEEGDA